MYALRRWVRIAGTEEKPAGLRAHRDRVNAKVMKDPRLSGMNPESMPFDCKRMVYGGFKVLVDV